MLDLNKIVEVYCFSDNFVKFVEGEKSSIGRKSMLSTAEYMTIIVLKHVLKIRTNKSLYNTLKFFGLDKMFSKLPSYQQFNDGMRRALPYLVAATSCLTRKNKKNKAAFYIVDSTPLPICANAHRYNVKIDNGLGKSGKNLNGWYFGFKLHLIIDQNMEVVGLCVTDAATKDYNALNGAFVKELFGFLIGDKGYVCKRVASNLAQDGLVLVTKPRKNMKKLPVTKDVLHMLLRREIIENIFSRLKLQFNMVTQFARSLDGFFVQVFGAILTFLIDGKLRKRFKIQEILNDSIS